MANQLKLSANVRTESGRGPAGRLRSAGIVPAVIYGHHRDPQSLQIPEREISLLLSKAVGEHLLVDLEISDGNKSETKAALLQEVQHHPLTGKILHVDLLEVSMDEEIEASIPIEPVGEANGVKNYGGLLEQLVRELQIRCLPKALPQVIHVDVSALGVGDAIHVSQIQLPEGVKATADGDIAVFLVAAPRVEAASTETAAAAPEVLREKKEGAAG
jgi:large subunit ribosomal protein L25